MKSLTDLHQINAFTGEAFKGNPAAVTYCENPDSELMKKIAKQMNLSETAFISKSDKADYKLQWFTPAIEVELCGHATIASLHYLKEREMINNKCSVTFETLSGIIECKVEDDMYFMKLPVPEFQNYDSDITGLLNVLDIDTASIDKQVSPILQGNSNLFIYVNTLDSLRNCKPNFKALNDLCRNNEGFTEVTVYTLETFQEENHAHLRFFAPYYGIDEDPVTGSVNGPLLLVLRLVGLFNQNTENKVFTFEQGDFLGRPGRINVSYSPLNNELVISGQARTMMKGEFFT